MTSATSCAAARPAIASKRTLVFNHQHPFCPLARPQRERCQSTVARSLLVNLDVLASGAAIALSAASLAAAATGEVPESRGAIADPDDDQFQWSIATVVSFIPYFGWMAWLLPATNTDSPQRYYAYAALYAVPALLKAAGVEDSGVLALTVLGAANLQVEIAAATNPQPAARLLNEWPTAKRWLRGATQSSAQQLGAFSEAVEYSIKAKEDETGQTMSLEDRRQLEEDIRREQELQGLEGQAWEERLRRRQDESKMD